MKPANEIRDATTPRSGSPDAVALVRNLPGESSRTSAAKMRGLVGRLSLRCAALFVGLNATADVFIGNWISGLPPARNLVFATVVSAAVWVILVPTVRFRANLLSIVSLVCAVILCVDYALIGIAGRPLLLLVLDRFS